MSSIAFKFQKCVSIWESTFERDRDKTKYLLTERDRFLQLGKRQLILVTSIAFEGPQA